MLLNYDVIFVEKVPFPVLAYLKWRTFSSTCSTSPIIMKFYQQVRSIERSKLAKFQDDIISIDGVMTSQNVRHDVKIWWRHISVKNVGIALKLCRLFERSCVPIFVSFHKVDCDLQKSSHLQRSFTYGVIDVSLRRTINVMVLKIL